jgi:hypothetical protein
MIGKGLGEKTVWPIALVYLLLAALTTAPLWRNLARAVPVDIGDPLLNTWIIAWDAHAWLADPRHLFDANIFFPLPGTLAYSEHLFSMAALALPLLLALGESVLAYNLLTIFHLALNGLGMYLLMRRWTGRRLPAFVAGLAFAFGPYRLGAIGHLQLVTTGWLPLTLLAVDGLLGKAGPARHYWVMLLAFLLMQTLAGWYLAVFTLLILSIYVVVGLAAGHFPRSRLGHLGLTLAPAFIVLALVAIPYVKVLPLLRSLRPPETAASFAAQPGDYLAASWFNRFFARPTAAMTTRPGFTDENALFPGVVAPACALLSLGALWTLRQGRWRLLAMGLILGLSLALTFGGPYALLSGLVPAFAVIRVPPRWIIPGLFALSALVGYGLSTLDGWLEHGPGVAWARHVAIILVAAGVFLEGYSAPLPLAPVPRPADLPPVYGWLAGQEGGFAILELPFYSAPEPEYPEVKRMYASIFHWKRLVNGYSGLTPPRQTALATSLRGFPDEEALAALRDLGRQGLRYVIVHAAEEGFDRQGWEEKGRWTAARAPTLWLAYADGADYAYEVNPYGPALVTNPEVVPESDPRWRSRRPRQVGATFADHFTLVAYKVDEVSDLARRSSPHLRVTLYWLCDQPATKDYTVFVHLLDSTGAILAQADSPPVEGHYPTGVWRSGEIIQDAHLIPLLAGGIPAGATLAVGLYDPATMERLAARDAQGRMVADGRVMLDLSSLR